MPITWKRLPPEIEHEVDIITDFTKRTGREASITVCKRPNKEKYLVANSAEGDINSTEVFDCDEAFGASDKIGDFHTHPVLYDTIGILPSPGDMAGYMEDSYVHKNRQIGCRTNHQVPYIHCMQPKEIPDKKLVNAYNNAADRGASLSQATRKGRFVDPFFLERVDDDFDYALFDRKTGERVDNPEPKKVIQSSLGTASRNVRRWIDEMDRGVFCSYVQDLTVPDDERIGKECRDELRTRKILGHPYEQYLPQRFLDSFWYPVPQQRKHCTYFMTT